MSHAVLTAGTVLRRIFVGADVGAVGVEHEAVHPELSGREHGGEGALQIFLVKRVAVVLPEVRAVPSVGDDVVVHEGADAAEDVVLRVAGPAAALTGSCGVPLPLRTVRHVDDVVQERLVHLAEVGLLGGPVVHLHVDVGVDVGVPGGVVHVAPDALEVGGQGNAAGGSDFEIASVGEIEVFEHQGVGTCSAVVGVDERVGRDGVADAVEFKAHAVPQSVVVFEVRVLEGGVVLGGSIVDGGAEVGGQLCRSGDVGRRCRVEVGGAGDDHHDVRSVGDGDAVLIGGDGAICAEVHDFEAQCILNGLGSP